MHIYELLEKYTYSFVRLLHKNKITDIPSGTFEELTMLEGL